MTRVRRLRPLVAALALAAAAPALAAPGTAGAADAHPCEKATTQPFSPEPVQRCPLVELLPEGAPLYAVPVANPQGATPPPPTSWVKSTDETAYFVCDREFPEAVFYHASGWRNRWWAYTRAHDGVWGWVPEVYLRGGADDEPDAGLRRCPPPPPPPPPPPTPPPPPPPDPCAPLPAADGLRLQALVRGARAVRTRWGRRPTVRGTLTDTSGAPLANAPVCVAEQPALTGAGERRLGTLQTDAAGAFELRLEAGGSRRLRFVHRVGDAAASATVTVRVRAPLTLSLSRRRVPAGGVVRLSGRLSQAPRRGLLVELQARRGRRYQTFGTTRTGRDGRYRYAYRFSRAGAGAAFALRARVPAQAGLGFATGASRSLRVRVTGG